MTKGLSGSPVKADGSLYDSINWRWTDYTNAATLKSDGYGRARIYPYYNTHRNVVDYDYMYLDGTRKYFVSTSNTFNPGGANNRLGAGDLNVDDFVHINRFNSGANNLYHKICVEKRLYSSVPTIATIDSNIVSRLYSDIVTVLGSKYVAPVD